MKKNIEQLYRLSNKEQRIIIGLMSGTSLDGLDVALCQINHDGVMTQVEIKRFATVSYDEHFKSEIRRVKC